MSTQWLEGSEWTPSRCSECIYCGGLGWPHTGIWCTHQLVPARLGDEAPERTPSWCPLGKEERSESHE